MSPLVFNLVAASLLVLLVLAIRRPVAAQFGARAAYALWLAPALRLVMPPLPAVPTTPATGEVGTAFWAQVIQPAASAVAPAPLSLLGDWLLIVWAAGALAMLGWHLMVHYRFVRRALRDGSALMVDGVTADVVATPAVEGPMATGLVHRLILVPSDFAERFTPEQRRFALLHEQLHHRRGDIWASAAALLGASALWFNPFAHVALGAFRRDMESACDASCLASAGRDQVQAYAATILASAARPVPRSLCALTSIDELKGRLLMLNLTHGAGRKFAGLLVAGSLAAAGMAIAAPASADEPKKETRTEVRKIIIHNEGDHAAGAKWEGKDGAEMKVDCPGMLEVFEADGGASPDKKERARIAICSKDGTPADKLAGLEKLQETLDENDDMDAGLKAQIKAKVAARIAELRAGK